MRRTNVTLISVYREDNVQFLEKLISQILLEERIVLNVFLHFMGDDLKLLKTPLVNHTISAFAPVDRMHILRTLAKKGLDSDYIIIADDDVVIADGKIHNCLEDFTKNQIFLGQPSHHDRSYCNYPALKHSNINLSFISSPEIGPLLVIKTEYFPIFFPDWIENQGFGLEFFWNHLRIEHSLKYAVHSGCTIQHMQETNDIINEIDRHQLDNLQELFISSHDIVTRVTLGN